MSTEALSRRPAAGGRFSLPLVLRLALRDLRLGWSGFAIFVACIALGVAAIAGIGSLAGALETGLARQGQTILGGDIALGPELPGGHTNRSFRLRYRDAFYVLRIDTPLAATLGLNRDAE